METKRCTKCGEEKRLSEFCKNKRSADGRTYRCRGCYKAYRTENGERIRQYMQKYWIRNRKKTRERLKEYRELNKEKIREYKKKYYELNRNKCLDRNRVSYQRNKRHNLSKSSEWAKRNPDKILKSSIRANFKARNGYPLPEDIVEVKFLINKTKQLCKTSTN